MNYALIENGFVVNIIVGLPDGFVGVCIDGHDVSTGDSYADGVFTHPVPTPGDALSTPDPDPLADCVAGLTDAQFESLPDVMQELLNKYRTVSPE